MSILKQQVNSSSHFLSFFSVILHNSSVNFLLMHFLLWTKGCHESTNFDTFKCSNKNLSNSSCHFPKQKSVFLQILRGSSVSWKITPLYFFGANVIYLHKRDQWKRKFLRLLSAWIKIHQIPVILGEISPEQSKVWNFALWLAPFVKMI